MARRLLFYSSGTGTSLMLGTDSDPEKQGSIPVEATILSHSERIFLLLVVSGIVSVMATAALLTPDPRGFGTHLQLGLPECWFRSATGFNCPNCGMTTSFAWFVRGEWRRSFQANSSGSLLAVLASVVCLWFLAVVIRGRWIGIQSPGLLFVYVFAGWVALSLVFWWLRLA